MRVIYFIGTNISESKNSVTVAQLMLQKRIGKSKLPSTFEKNDERIKWCCRINTNRICLDLKN